MALTKSELFTLIGSNLPDNTSGAITPEDVREVCTQLADSMLYASAGVKEVEVLRTASTATQLPTALNTPLQVTFGPAQGGVSDPVVINALGLVTFNVAGVYAVRIKLQNGRAGSSGVSVMLTRINVNGAPVGSPQAVKITSADVIFPSESRVVINATAGMTFSTEIMRDSAGTNFGGLYPYVAALPAWGTAPSALLVVSRLEAV